MKKKTRLGIWYDNNNHPHLDCTIFAKCVKEKLHLLCDEQGFFYRYRKGVWSVYPMLKLRKKLFRILDKKDPRMFNRGLESQYLNTLAVICYCDVEFNKRREYVNVRNGLLNLKKKTLEEHTPDVFSSIQLPLEYNPDAKCHEFKKFLDTTFQGDVELISVVQEMMGYCLSADMNAQKFFILYGSGANGKSVLCNVLRQLVGEGNYSAIPLSDLGKSFSRADLKDKILNLSTENESSGRAFNSQYLKAITGGDDIEAEFKGKDIFVFKPVCKLIFAVNALPSFRDTSHGFLRRVMIIPFENTFSIDEGTADVDIEKKLKKELSGILNFAIEGLYRLRKNNYRFTQCAKIEKYLDDYAELINPFNTFVAEHISVTGDKKDAVPRKAVFGTFICWANKNNYRDLAKYTPKKFWMDFNRSLQQLGHAPLGEKKVRGQRCVTGMQLKSIYEN